MFARVAQLPSNPEDIEPLRAALGAQKETNSQKMEIHLAHVEAALGGAKPQTLPKDPAAWQDH